ncbi:MAG: PAS domain S-box protein [Methylovulum sp.]|nr:PAS domain S-box protein [Methylovulum sp.]
MKKGHIRTDTQANAGLTCSEQRFKRLIEQLDQIVFTVNAEGCFTFLNPAWQARTGYGVAEAIGMPVKNFIYPDDAPLWEQNVLIAENTCFEIRFLDKYDNLVWFEATVKPDPDQPQGFLGELLDITGRIRSAEELRASKERFSLAATASNDGIWDWDIKTDEVYFSPRWKEMLGYADDELENRYATWYNLIHPDDLTATIASLTACLEGNSTLYESVHRLRNKSGGWSWILDRGIVMRDASGQALRMAGSHADITHLKHIEEQLLARKQELNTIFSISPDGIVTLTSDNLISSVNPRFLSMTGLSQEQLMRLPEQEWLSKMTALCPAGRSFAIDENRPYTLVQIQPANGFVDGQCDANPDSVGGNTGVQTLKVTVCKLANESISKVLYFRDVTIETEIDRMKSEFLSTSAHELRTPMSSVYGFTELLLTRTFDQATTQEILRNIYQQSACLVRMINDLLDLAKIEAGIGNIIHLETQALDAVAKQAIAEFMVQGDDRTVKAMFTNEAYLVDIDADQIKRALTNIISNAFKYSPDGGEVSITLCRRQLIGKPDEVGVLVKDHGIGMTQEQVGHLFERFWRASNTSHITGTGLGMSLVKEIMALHHGHVEVNSTPGIGTEIGLWFKSSTSEGVTYAHHC